MGTFEDDEGTEFELDLDIKDPGRYLTATVGMALAAPTMVRDPGTEASRDRDALSTVEDGRAEVVDGTGKVRVVDANIGGGNGNVDSGRCGTGAC